MNLAKKCLMILSLLFLFSYIPSVVDADSSIHIEIEEGYDGTAKLGKAYPIQITLTNNGGDFSGELLIPFMTDYSLGGTKIIEVDLPANSKKTYTEVIPGHTDYSPPTNQITMFEGSRHQGKKISLTGKKELRPRIMEHHEPTLGILSESTERLNALQLIKMQNRTPTIVHLSDDILSEQSLGLQYFDLIIVDDYPLSLLSEEQQRALIHWVSEGGNLLIGASTKGNHAWGQLESLLPINSTDITNITDLTFFLVDEESEMTISSLQVATGSLHENAEVKVTSDEIPVVAMNRLGKGEIWQVAFSIGDDPIADWSDYPKWIESLISQTNYKRTSNHHYESDYQATYYSIGQINELFPVTQFSIGTIVLIMLGYLIVIVPLLYFILLKRDKREHAWWIIPVVSIVMSFGIFGIGAKDRLASPILAELGMYAANENGDLNGEYSLSIFSNTSGDYQIAIPKGEFTGVSTINTGVFGEMQQGGAMMSSSMFTDNYTFPNVEYWSTRSIVGHQMKANVGKFGIHLELVDDHLLGTIENEYPYDFEQVFIWSGSDIYELGNLQQGDSIMVEQKLKHNLLMRPIAQSVHYVDSDLEEMKINGLESTLIQNIHSSNLVNSPIVFGYTRDSVSNAEIVNRNEKNDRLSLIYMPFTVQGSLKGEFSLGNSQLSFDIEAITGQVYEDFYDDDYVDMENGIYDVIISLPAQLDYTKVEFESIQINLHDNIFLDISLLNQKSGDYLEVDSGSSQVVLEDDVAEFVSSEGKIMMRIEKNDPDHDPFVMIPHVTVKGAVK